MLKIALTGNIASGKSTVQKILEADGYKVLDTDQTAHILLDEIDGIKAEFPQCIENGKISREKLGKLVFTNAEFKSKLENIIHPEIRLKIIAFFEENTTEPFVFVGIPLLFEAGMTDLFDKTILVYTDDKIREKRLILRNNYSLQQAHLRMNAQMPQEGKKRLCDYVIYNNGSFADLKNSIEECLSKLKQE